MQSFTKNEINWIIGELDKLAYQMKELSMTDDATQVVQGICMLRCEQFQSISNRLSDAVKHEDKRIEIKY